MYNKNEKAIIFLSLFEITPAKINKLFCEYDEPSQFLENLAKDKFILSKILGEDLYHKMISTDLGLLDKYIENLDNSNTKVLTVCSKDYPDKLREIAEPPAYLFYKGDLSLLNKQGLAIVGTRNPTAYARGVTEDFAKKIAGRGVVIISGLASGVDKIAHENAINVNGKTIAVLGSGFNRIYPALNTNLASEIAEKGLLISEYRPNVSATKYTFPYRNRIISALSDGVLVTEAGEKSGALYTKNYALEQGKELFVIPANINNPRAIGTNRILKSLQGAMVTEPEDILLQYGIPLEEPQKVKVVQGNLNEQLILKAIEDGNQNIESLQEITKLETKTLNSCLTMLQIRGLIKKLPGNEYSL